MRHRTAGARWAVALATCLPCLAGSVTAIPAVESGYRQMYNLDFDEAHKTFGALERDHPNDPIGVVSNAAAYLFAEFDRLNILHSEFFVEDSMFRRRPKLTADPAARKAFDAELDKSLHLAGRISWRDRRAIRMRCSSKSWRWACARIS